MRARYRAARDEIAARYVELNILGSPEVRDVDRGARYFTPHNSSTAAALRGYIPRSSASDRPGRRIPTAGNPPPIRYVLRQARPVRRDERSRAITRGDKTVGLTKRLVRCHVLGRYAPSARWPS